MFDLFFAYDYIPSFESTYKSASNSIQSSGIPYILKHFAEFKNRPDDYDIIARYDLDKKIELPQYLKNFEFTEQEKK